MSRRDEDLSAIAWPGFVDILSAVIIMFVFFLLIVATSLYFHIIIYKSKVKSSLVAELVQSEHEFEFSQAQTQFAESENQTTKFDVESKTLFVFFGDDAISVTPETKIDVQNELKRYLSEAGAGGYKINVFASKTERGLDTIKRQIAVARMLNVRNVIMESGFEPNSIIPKMIDSYDVDGNEHWVKIELIEK